MEKILKKIVEKLQVKKEDFLLFNKMSKKPIKINKKNFHDILDKKTKKTIAFIDGGNLEIIKSPSLSLFFNRIYYCIYKNNKRINKKRIEFYSLITSDKDKISTTCYPKIIKDYDFDPFDKTLIKSKKRISTSILGNLLRRLCELKTAEKIKAEFVVLDGSLDFVHEYEKQIISNFENVAGLSKTTNMITKNGLSITGYLNKITDNNVWFYKANDELYFVKLHKNSKYVFKLDYNKNDLAELLSLLKENSKDPIFLGYPYGLVEADRFARVSKKEKEILLINIRTKLKDNYKIIEPHLNSVNSHDILDNIS